MDVDEAHDPNAFIISRKQHPAISDFKDVARVENAVTMASLLLETASASASPSITALALLNTDVDVEATPPPTAGTDIDQWPLIIEEDLPRPFDSISSDLVELGALSIDDFLSNVTNSNAVFDVNFYVQLPEQPQSPKDGEGGDVKADGGGDDNEQAKTEEQKAMKGMVSMLHEASHRVFGSSDCLKFEYMEEDPKDKQCILTITRPNGSIRSYKSDPGAGFTRRQEARMQAAKIAVEMGAVDFILSGDADALKAKKGLLLNPFDVEVDANTTEGVPGMPNYNEEEKPLKFIEETCQEWRAGKVKPHWVIYNDAKNKKKHGAAVRISLNAHVFRSYSVDPIYSYQRQAKLACAQAAVEEGVIDFIQFGNGQTQPAKVVEQEEGAGIREPTPPPPPKGVTLQEFFDTLPRPFPEDVGETPANEINAPAWINLRLQSARGGRLVSSFTPIVDGIRHLHGCILRIQRPGETRTYLVDPQFPRRSDAKSAVCLLAMSQGVGNYIRGLKEEAENKLSAERRKLANEKIIQALFSECAKVKPGNRLFFIFQTERDAFGCTLKVDISPDQPDVREYTVNTEYRNKADAKAAVACHAAEQGLVDLLRFKGGPPPSDYTPFWQAQVHGDGDHYVVKRKDRDRDPDGEGQDRKRRKSNFNQETMGAGDFMSQMRAKIKEEGPPNGKFFPNRKPSFGFGPNVPTGPSLKNSWQKPRPPVPGGLAPTNVYASSSHSAGQDRAGPRDVQQPQAYSSRPPVGPRAYSELNAPFVGPSHQPRPPQNVRRSYSQSTSYPLPPLQTQAPHPSYHPPALYPAPTPPAYPTDLYARPDQYPHPSYPQQQPPAAYHPAPPQPVHYPSVSDPYAGGYPGYLPPPAVHYPGYPPAPPHFPGYYPTPPLPAPSPASYGHYVHPHPYPPYPAGHFHPGYLPPQPMAHPGHYASPPPPAPMSMSSGYPNSAMASPQPPPHQHPPRFRSPYSPSFSPPHQTYSLSPSSPPNPPPHSQYSPQHYNKPPHRNNLRYPPSEASHGEHSGRSEQNRQGDAQSRPKEASVASSKSGQDASVKEEPEEQLLVHEPPAPPEPPIEAPPLPDTNLASLYEYCHKENIPRPKFLFEIVNNPAGQKRYKIWAEHYSQRLELPTLFDNYELGREKLAKRVLGWVQAKLAAKQG
ncbi:hypothetical protein CPB83DRAFT_621767 [Crepidotus variabilis]|uniref:Uncharacterized protein n=1 Tax=Crepidotus variabilis TaxID=179855 RepID=A0A9P6E7Z9_9AGAR|nr:hypothetical protein CPB83DRAFT_621767 [Crepidotus variabilis]